MIDYNYEIVFDNDDEIRIRDVCKGIQMSVTNAAERVVTGLLIQGLLYAGKRLTYYDTAGDLDELCHDGYKFTGFARYADTNSLTHNQYDI